MQLTPRESRIYRVEDGRLPFCERLGSLQDPRARAKIRVRLDRVSLGDFGDCRTLDQGLYALRFEYGAGHYVYFGQLGSTIVLLLCGSGEQPDADDIALAKRYWAEYRRRP